MQIEKPRCEQCESEGKKYSVNDAQYDVTGSTPPTPGYWDKDGLYHKPVDPVAQKYTYSCSNGHTWAK